MSATPFTARLADWHDDRDRDRMIAVRFEVFVVEQKVDKEIEIDGLDPDQAQFIAELSDSGEAIGTARLATSGKVGRVAVLNSWRGRGVGLAIMRAVIAEAETQAIAKLYLHGQTWTVPFYEKLGFAVDETVDEFMEADIPHRRMVREL